MSFADTVSPSPPEPAYLSGLNPEQRDAVLTTEGALLVLSGAGTGKTRVLTTRLSHILHAGLARPWEIMAVTFTNKAAREMRERVARMIGDGPAEQVRLGTFHALGANILRRHAEIVGLKSNFTILDADDQVRLLKQLMEAENIDPKRFPPQGVMGQIQRWKDRGLTPDQVTDAALTSDLAGGRTLSLYKQYQDRLKVLNAADFGDLLLHCLSLFKQAPDVLSEYQGRLRYVLVDEYQDTNVAQYLWLRLLAQKHGNLCCVGDDDQSIYSWRGAEVANILKFERDYPGAKVIRLERNYRSTPAILAAASTLISCNAERLGKTLMAAGDNAEAGEPVHVQGVWDGDDEARWVVEKIEDSARANIPLAEMAILVRASFQMREFEDRLITTGTPYRVVGGPRFYERAEIRDAIAYLRLINQPDDDLAFERIVNKPRRGLGDASVQAIHMAARGAGTSLMAAAQLLAETDELKPKARKSLADFCQSMERWRSQTDGLSPPELAAVVLDESGYTEMWQRDKSVEAAGKLENLKEFVAALEDFETLAEFLEHVSLVMDNDARADEPGVTLMTLHAAKGLEFDVVFLAGWEEEVFPHRRALDETGRAGLEEERRLAYVGITRARKRAFITHAANRRIFNQWQACIPSRFIDELPVEHIDTATSVAVNAPGSGGGYGAGYGGGYTRAARNRKTMQAMARQNDPWQDGDDTDTLSIGDRVFHEKFGYGVIVGGDPSKLVINFENAGEKRVLPGFVSRAD